MSQASGYLAELDYVGFLAGSADVLAIRADEGSFKLSTRSNLLDQVLHLADKGQLGHSDHRGVPRHGVLYLDVHFK